jgi:hypothetical protein
VKPNDTTDDRDQRLAEVKEKVLFHAHPTPRLAFIASRWPYTYAADFVRSHEGIIPDSIWDGMEISGLISRAQASQARTRWANFLSLEDYDVAELLACGYLIEHNYDVDTPDARRLLPTWLLLQLRQVDPDEG